VPKEHVEKETNTMSQQSLQKQEYDEANASQTHTKILSPRKITRGPCSLVALAMLATLQLAAVLAAGSRETSVGADGK